MTLNHPGSDGDSVLSGGWKDGPVFKTPREVRERAVALVLESQSDYDSRWEAIVESGHDRCAPWGASLYPRRSREELGGTFLNRMVYLGSKGY